MSTIQAEFIFSPRILEHLGISSYNSVRKCLSELVANAYDADAKKVSITLPDVIDDNAVITLEDDGIGMTPDDIKTKFLHIGRNRRTDGEKTDSGRLIIGSKGIGKLAGFGIASRIRVTSWKNGIQSAVTIDREILDTIKTLSEHKLEIIVSETQHTNGTKLELINLHKGLTIQTPEIIRNCIFVNMPVRKDFSIFVNDVECTAEDIPGIKINFSDDIEGVGGVTGYYIIAETKQKAPGLGVRVRGRIVQEPSLFGLDTRSHGFFSAAKIAGEINAEFLDPEKKEEGEFKDFIKTSRDGFLEDANTVLKFNEWASLFVKRIIQGIDDTENIKRTEDLLSTPEIKVRLEKLPPHIRGTSIAVVRGIISKLNTASDEDAKNLVEWILKESLNKLAS